MTEPQKSSEKLEEPLCIVRISIYIFAKNKKAGTVQTPPKRIRWYCKNKEDT
jgi:hypothetical protein